MTAPSVTPSVVPSSSRDGLRRLCFGRDLAALADLIEVAYQDELALTGSNLVERLRQLANMAPLIGIIDHVAAILDGYVWIEDDELVGNVTISQARDAAGLPIPQSWAVSNVAVLPEYRGRGIGGKLVDAALAYLQAMDARCVLLQVRHDNAPAIALYQHRGFQIYQTITEYQLQRRWIPPRVNGPSRDIGPLRWRDSKKLVEFAHQSQPKDLRRIRKLSRSDFGLAPWQWLLYAVAAKVGLVTPSTHVAHENGQLLAYTHLRSIGSRTLFLRLGLKPELDQELLRPLVATALVAARSTPWSRVLSQVPIEERGAQAALEELGFEPLRTLHSMIWRTPRLSDGIRYK